MSNPNQLKTQTKISPESVIDLQIIHNWLIKNNSKKAATRIKLKSMGYTYPDIMKMQNKGKGSVRDCIKLVQEKLKKNSNESNY